MVLIAERGHKWKESSPYSWTNYNSPWNQVTQLNNHFKLLGAAKTNYEELEKPADWPIKWQMKSNTGVSVVIKKKQTTWPHLIRSWWSGMRTVGCNHQGNTQRSKYGTCVSGISRKRREDLRECVICSAAWQVYPHSVCRIQLSCKGSKIGSGDNQRHGMAFARRMTNGLRTLPTAEETTEGEYARGIKSDVVWRKTCNSWLMVQDLFRCMI